MCFCHSSFCGVRFDEPSQAMEALQPTRTHNYTHSRRRTHQTDRQTGSGLGISALCVPSSAVFSRSVSLSLCFDVACACQQRACAIISARGAGRPLSLPTVKCRWRWTVYPHTAKFRSDVLPQYFFLAKCIGM